MNAYILATTIVLLVIIGIAIAYFLYEIWGVSNSIKEDDQKIAELEKITSVILKKKELKFDKKSGYVAMLIITLSLGVWLIMLISATT